MKLKFLIAAFLVIFNVMGVAGSAHAEARHQSKPTAVDTNGYDVSYPNCNATPPVNPAFGIVGVMDGLGYSQNPCLARQATWFGANLSLYANSGWYDQSSHINPTSPRLCAAGDANCLAYNYGYNDGLYALNYANSQGVSSAKWWIDVETGNTWNADVVQNQNSLQGEFDALAASGAAVGVYSTTYQWDTITGGWLPGWHNWGATTVRTASQAATFCTGHEFAGASTLLIQYTGSLDRDYAC